jgi:hypothetical protein
MTLIYQSQNFGQWQNVSPFIQGLNESDQGAFARQGANPGVNYLPLHCP